MLSMQLGGNTDLADNYSRNKIKNKLNNALSTKERLDQQESNPSISQFTFSNAPVNINPEGKSKISKYNSSLFADYRKRSVIEEEKSHELDPSSLRMRKIQVNTSDEEEKKSGK